MNFEEDPLEILEDEGDGVIEMRKEKISFDLRYIQRRCTKFGRLAKRKC